MDIMLLADRLLLATIFVVAAMTKLADQRGFRQSLSDFSVPRFLVPSIGVALPLTELAVAIALIPRSTAWWGALGAFILLIVFSGGIANQLAHGHAPECHCFGQLHSAPVGWPTLVRNTFLAAVGGLVIAHGRADTGLSANVWLGTLSMADWVSMSITIVAVAAVVAQSWLVIHLLKQNGRLLLRMEAIETQLIGEDASSAPEAGLPIGTKAPSFQLPNLQGDRVTLDTLTAESKPTLLVFVDPSCGPCNALLPDFATFQQDYSDKLTVAIISTGKEDLVRAKAVEHGLDQVLIEERREIAKAYQADGTPSAVMIWPNGTIGSPLAQGRDQIQSLVSAIVDADSMPRPMHPKSIPLPMAHERGGNGHADRHASEGTLKAGDVAPAITLPDLEGKMVDLADFRGEEILVLFWNPDYGFCRRMLPNLKAWEVQPPANAPKLLVVSAGDYEANVKLGLRSPIVLDEGFSTGFRYGMGGTPSAILIDEHGKIAAQSATGLPQVQALLNDVKHSARLVEEMA
jgi:methylamine dehydrogenase accessory protein MauD